MMRRGPTRRKIEVILGLALYLGLVLMFSLSVLASDTHVSFSQGRVRGALSDIGTLATLLIAAPVVFYAAFRHWPRK